MLTEKELIPREDIAELRNDTARARMEQQARFKLLDQRNKQ
jgi:hypothetical protein